MTENEIDRADRGIWQRYLELMEIYDATDETETAARDAVRVALGPVFDQMAAHLNAQAAYLKRSRQ